MSLCTLAQVHALLGIGVADTEHDALLATLISSVSSRLALLAGRSIDAVAAFESAAQVEYFSPALGTQVLYLTARPVSVVTEIKEATYGAFDEATALTVNEDYQIHQPTGKLMRIGHWQPGMMAVRVTYTGGYVAAGGTPGDGETAMPADITDAAARQVAFSFRRRGQLGVRSAGGGGASYQTYAADDLLPEVREVALSYARMIG